MSVEPTTVGLDVHARSTTACAITGPTGEITTTRLNSDHTQILDWIHTPLEPVRVAYEAGPTGFALARTLTGAHIDCTVAAPSKLQRPSGERIKTDSRDALHLARLLRLEEITPVTVPSPAQEAARGRTPVPRSISRGAASFPPNSPSCGSQPAHISLTTRRA